MKSCAISYVIIEVMERLLDYFTPETYHLELFINKHEGTARGRTTITGQAHRNLIKLHAKDLTIDRVTVDGQEKPHQLSSDTLEINEVSTSDDLILAIDYHFVLNRNMMGAYLSSYQYEDKEELLVSTQFESHYARECFPCIDEPSAKATFDLELTVPDLDDTVIANTPVRSVVENTTPIKSKTVIFETTPRMSTYLVAFCIGRFQSKSTKSKHGVDITTYCALNQDTNSLDFANQIAADALDYYDDKFGVPYPLPKLDQVAIPDFEAGAMENWGLVTYRESCMLAGKSSTITDRQYVATVITHELSHQWFGNLVTMAWWDDLWLNESFANIIEYLCVDAIRPEYKILENFFVGECRAALSRDALPGVQAVHQDVNDPAEIATLFDGAIVYAKGARLMFMLYRLMGERSFFAGLREYFKQHQYQNTTGDDLWSALQPHADFDVKEFMTAWISQPGFPVITDDNQQRFLLTGATDESSWPLPEVTDDMSGHYLINLSGDEFKQKLKEFGQLNFEQKVRLLLDRSLLAKTSLVSTSLHLDLLPRFREEKDYVLWLPISSLVSDLKLFFPPTDPDFQAFQRYVSYIVKPGIERLGIQACANEPEDDTKLRPLLLGYALYAEDAKITADLAQLYNIDYAQLDPELRDCILLAKLRTDERQTFAELLEHYQSETNPDIKDDILSTLAHAKQHTRELVALLNQPKVVRPQDHLYLFIYLLRNPDAKSATITWLYENWEYVKTLSGEKTLEDYPRLLASCIRTQAEAERFREFFAPFAEDPILKRALKVAQADIDARLRLIMEDETAVHARLRALDY